MVRYSAKLSLAVLLALALTGCQYDPYAHRMTTSKPQSADVVGRYVLTTQTLTTEGMAALGGRVCSIELYADGTFKATNVLPLEMHFRKADFFSQLVSGTGEWRIGSVGTIAKASGDQRHWGIYLDAVESPLASVGLLKNESPYELIYTLDDPDSGEVLILERE